MPLLSKETAQEENIFSLSDSLVNMNGDINTDFNVPVTIFYDL
jgi:hypothetical protein